MTSRPPGAGTSASKEARPTPFRAALGAALQRHRLHRGLTQAQLAESADLSLKYVGEIERGEANTTLDAIERLAAAIGWDPMAALDGAREPITEGIRLHLLTIIQRTREQFADMEDWLRALDPATSGPPPANCARHRRRASAPSLMTGTRGTRPTGSPPRDGAIASRSTRTSSPCSAACALNSSRRSRFNVG